MAEIIRITSEALQATIRRLLPSQQGFGDDLQASNVIVPVIDLTPTAEGSSLPDYLQQAINYDDANEFASNNDTVQVITTPGFWQLNGSISHNFSLTDASFTVTISDGTSFKTLYSFAEVTTGASFNEIFFNYIQMPIVLIKTGGNLSVTTGAGTFVRGSARQIADINGNLIDPSGYVSQ